LAAGMRISSEGALDVNIVMMMLTTLAALT
jgi:hypothetical protein